MSQWNPILTAIMLIVGALCALALAIGIIWYKFRQGKDVAQGEALEDWKQLAESRLAVIKELRQSLSDMNAEVGQHQAHLNECLQLRDEFAKHNLRLQARELIYQRCINRLESRLNLMPTNFDDPIPRGLET